MTKVQVFIDQLDHILNSKWQTESWIESQVKADLRNVKLRLAVLATLFERQHQGNYPHLNLNITPWLVSISIERHNNSSSLLLWNAFPCQLCSCQATCDPSDNLSDSFFQEWNQETTRLEIRDTAKFFAKCILFFLVVLVAAYYYLFLWKH